MNCNKKQFWLGYDSQRPCLYVTKVQMEEKQSYKSNIRSQLAITHPLLDGMVSFTSFVPRHRTMYSFSLFFSLPPPELLSLPTLRHSRIKGIQESSETKKTQVVLFDCNNLSKDKLNVLLMSHQSLLDYRNGEKSDFF